MTSSSFRRPPRSLRTSDFGDTPQEDFLTCDTCRASLQLFRPWRHDFDASGSHHCVQTSLAANEAPAPPAKLLAKVWDRVAPADLRGSSGGEAAFVARSLSSAFSFMASLVKPVARHDRVR